MHYFLKHAEKKPLETIAEVSSEDESDQYSEYFECSTSTNLLIKQNNNKSLYDKLYLVKDDLLELVDHCKTKAKDWNNNLLWIMWAQIAHLILCLAEKFIKSLLPPPKPLQLHARTPQHTLK
jgi:hypothetical protein